MERAFRTAANTNSQTASLLVGEPRDMFFGIASILRKFAAIYEVHGYAGLLGAIAMYDYNTPVGEKKAAVLKEVQRLMKGDF